MNSSAFLFSAVLISHPITPSSYQFEADVSRYVDREPTGQIGTIAFCGLHDLDNETITVDYFFQNDPNPSRENSILAHQTWMKSNGEIFWEWTGGISDPQIGGRHRITGVGNRAVFFDPPAHDLRTPAHIEDFHVVRQQTVDLLRADGRGCLMDFVITKWMRIPLGDANRDGAFDSSDLIAVFQAGEFDDRLSGNSTWETGDWNRDFEFDSADLTAAFQGGEYTAGDHVAPVPEPSAASFTLIGLLCSTWYMGVGAARCKQIRHRAASTRCSPAPAPKL